jgi:protocatechuate 3,4-dioxygenase beta subunit
MLRRAPLLLLLAALAAVAWLCRDLLSPGDVVPAGERETAEELDFDPPPDERAEEAEDERPLLRAAERPRLAPEEQAARDAAHKAAIEAAEKAGRVAFAGTLLDAEGRPVAGARLVIAGGAQALALTSADDGGFAGQVKPGRYDLFVTAPGRGSVVLEGYVIDGAARLDLELKLQPPSRVTVVLERGGRGLEGAAIDLKHSTWRWQGEAPVYRQSTDAGGRATFPDLAQGLYDLTAVIPQGPVLRQPLAVKQDAEVRVVVPDAAELHGVVTEAGTGRVVGGAEVTVTTALGKGPRLECSITTQSDGTYRFSVPQGNAVALSVRATGFAPWPDARSLGKVLGTLKGLATGKSAVSCDAALIPGGAVAGRVAQDGTDTPLPGLVLAFRPRRGEVVRATTAEQGRYAVPHLNPGSYEVVVETPGWFPPKPLQVVVPPEATGPVVFDIALLGARAVSGVVVHHEGTRAGGARVWLTGGGQIVRSARAAGRPLETFTSSDGRWTISDVPPNLDVVVRAAWGLLEAAPVGISAARPRGEDLRLVLAPTGALFGRVTEVGGGEPVVGARVRLRPRGEPGGRDVRTVTTDADGRWRVETLIPGDYDVVLSARDYLPPDPRPVSLAAGTKEERVDLLLDPGLVLAGFVTDEHGRAVAGAAVGAEGPSEAGATIRRQGTSGPDGRFRLIGFLRGTYRLRVSANGFHPQFVERLLGGEDRLRVALVAAPPSGS